MLLRSATAARSSSASRTRLGRGLAFVVVSMLGQVLMLGPSSRASAAEPPLLQEASPPQATLADAPLLVASREPGLHEPPQDYAPYELLPRIADRKEFELKIEPEDSWRLVPREDALRVEVRSRDYRDYESGRPRFTTSALDANDQRSVVGGRLLSTRPWRETGRLHTETRLLWLCEFMKSDDGPTSFFAPGDSNIFVTQGMRYGSNWALLGGRVSWDLAGGLKAFAAYDAQVNSLEMFHIGSTGVGYTW